MRIGADHVASILSRGSHAATALRDSRHAHVRGRDRDPEVSDKGRRVADRVDVKPTPTNALGGADAPADRIDQRLDVPGSVEVPPGVPDSIDEDDGTRVRGHERELHVLRKGARQLVKDVKDATKDLLKSVDGEKHTQRDVRHHLRDFRADVRGAVSSQRRAGDADPAALASDLESAFAAFEASLRETLGGGVAASDEPATSSPDPVPGAPSTSNEPTTTTADQRPTVDQPATAVRLPAPDQPSISNQLSPSDRSSAPEPASALDEALAAINATFRSALDALLADLGYQAEAPVEPVTPDAPTTPVDPVDPPLRGGSGLVNFGSSAYSKIAQGVPLPELIDTIA